MPLTKVTSSLINTISASQIQASGASAGQILAYDGSTWVATASGSSGITRGTAVTLTNQTSVDFTGIPSTAKRVTVMLNNVSTNGTTNYLIQLGSGSAESTGYVSWCMLASPTVTITSSTAGFHINSGLATNSLIGTTTLTNLSGYSWISTSIYPNNLGAGSLQFGGGSKTLSGALDRVRLTTANGTDQFDAGTVNIMWE